MGGERVNPEEREAVVQLMERRGWLYRVDGLLRWTHSGKIVTPEDAAEKYGRARGKEARL